MAGPQRDLEIDCGGYPHYGPPEEFVKACVGPIAGMWCMPSRSHNDETKLVFVELIPCFAEPAYTENVSRLITCGAVGSNDCHFLCLL